MGSTWTEAKEFQLRDLEDEISRLQFKKGALVKEQRAEGISIQKAFLTELAALLSKHKVAVCADVEGNDKVHAEVYYAFASIDHELDLSVYRNGRSHSTGGEYLCRLEQIV